MVLLWNALLTLRFCWATREFTLVWMEMHFEILSSFGAGILPDTYLFGCRWRSLRRRPASCAIRAPGANSPLSRDMLPEKGLAAARFSSRTSLTSCAITVSREARNSYLHSRPSDVRDYDLDIVADQMVSPARRDIMSIRRLFGCQQRMLVRIPRLLRDGLHGFQIAEVDYDRRQQIRGRAAFLDATSPPGTAHLHRSAADGRHRIPTDPDLLRDLAACTRAPSPGRAR